MGFAQHKKRALPGINPVFAVCDRSLYHAAAAYLFLLRRFHRQCGKIGKHTVRRDKQFFRPALVCHTLYLAYRDGLINREAARAGSSQTAHTPAAADHLANIIAECTDIGALTAPDIKQIIFAVFADKVYAVDGDASCGALNFLSPAGDLIQTLSVHLYGGIHRGYLHDFPGKA